MYSEWHSLGRTHKSIKTIPIQSANLLQVENEPRIFRLDKNRAQFTSQSKWTILFFHMSKMTSLFHLYTVSSIQQNIQPNVRRYLWWIILIQQMMRYFCCVYSSFLIKSTSKFDGSLLHVANYKGFITQYPILLHSINGFLF